MAGKLDPQYDATLAAVARIRTECERLRQELDAHRLREHRHREAV